MDAATTLSMAANAVTVVGLPLAIYIFLHEQRRERENEEEEIFQLLSDSYTDFLKLVLANPDLRLRTNEGTPDLTDEQHERMMVIFDLLVSLFERAYLLAYEEHMNPRQARRWRAWDDWMREWCRREDFRRELPGLMRGEDPDFVRYITAIAAEEGGGDSQHATGTT
jgi:hypothetical protein